MFITINNLKIHYTDQGAGEPILLLHGWGSSVDVWKGIISAFCGTHRLIALDFPGCGKSNIPDRPLNSDDYANLVLEFTKALNIENPILIGHSHGGRTIIKLVGNGMLTPKKIVLIDSAGLIPKKSLKKKLKIRAFKTIKWALTLPFIKKYTESLLEKARSYFGSADYKSAPEVLRKTLVNLVNEDLSHLLPKIKASTLLIWGDQDTATPLSDAQKMEKLIPDAGLCVIKGTGHFSFLERPFEVIAILKSFLS
ncbi:MAG TPA: alpha/beta hydrolase [Clostridiales bacterium]|nr:alpha/beta hydrolase [Clostridiales bacterium]